MPIPPLPRSSESDAGSIFDKLIEDYGVLAERAEDMVFQHVCGEVEMELKAHFFRYVQVSNKECPVISSEGRVPFNINLILICVYSISPLHTTTVKRHHSHTSGQLAEPSTEAQHDYEIEIPSTLMAPVSLFSSYLAYFKSSLSSRMLADLYRKITARISNGILQKMIIQRGPGSVSVKEGRAIATECELWLETSRAALSGGNGGGRGVTRLVEGPWRRLVEAGRLLALQGPEWERVTGLTFGTSRDEDWEQGILEVVGFSELRRDEVQTVLRTRVGS